MPTCITSSHDRSASPIPLMSHFLFHLHVFGSGFFGCMCHAALDICLVGFLGVLLLMGSLRDVPDELCCMLCRMQYSGDSQLIGLQRHSQCPWQKARMVISQKALLHTRKTCKRNKILLCWVSHKKILLSQLIACHSVRKITTASRKCVEICVSTNAHFVSKKFCDLDQR